MDALQQELKIFTHITDFSVGTVDYSKQYLPFEKVYLPMFPDRYPKVKEVLSLNDLEFYMAREDANNILWGRNYKQNENANIERAEFKFRLTKDVL